MGHQEEVRRTIFESADCLRSKARIRRTSPAGEQCQRELVHFLSAHPRFEPRPAQWRALWRKFPFRRWPRKLVQIEAGGWSSNGRRLGLFLQDQHRLKLTDLSSPSAFQSI